MNKDQALMNDVTVDPTDLLRQYDSVSRSQRTLVAEFERQRSRLVQLVRWYDHQQIARDSELRREFEYVNKEARRKIEQRSQMAVKERARLQHILDDDLEQIFTLSPTRPLFTTRTHSTDRKRRAYGCLLPEFKAPMRQASNLWTRQKCHSSITLTDFQKYRDSQTYGKKKNHLPRIEQQQQNRMKTVLDRCLSDFGYDDGVGYDHFLQTSEPNRNAQILAQQLINEKQQQHPNRSRHQ